MKTKHEKFNYTARETIHYSCPCCAAVWQTNKLDYCPNCEVRMTYASQLPTQQPSEGEMFKILAGKCISDDSAKQAVRDITELLNHKR